MSATTIDEVLAELDRMIQQARSEESALGYFPALYRQVTRAVKDGIEDGVFEDGERLERLDVLFANRYLEAWRQHRQAETPTSSWQTSFEAGGERRLIVLQHLLLGMNAHINLDLAIATAQTAPGAELAALQPDFLKINEILAAKVDGVKAALTKIWPKLKVLDFLAGTKDDRLINFSLSKARDHSWALAEELNAAPADEHAARIATADRRVTKIGWLILKPGPIGRIKTWIVRSGERGSAAEIIDLLA